MSSSIYPTSMLFNKGEKPLHDKFVSGVGDELIELTWLHNTKNSKAE